jgi:hypothetical protein
MENSNVRQSPFPPNSIVIAVQGELVCGHLPWGLPEYARVNILSFANGKYQVQHAGKHFEVPASCIRALPPDRMEVSKSGARLQKPEWMFYATTVREQIGRLKPQKSGHDMERLGKSSYEFAIKDKGYRGSIDDWFYVLGIGPPRNF